MPTEISVRASDLSSSSRVFPWPVLEAGNGSYENGVYTVACEDREPGRSILLQHEVEGAPLIHKWMESGKIRFVCSVASPRSMYRKLHVSNTPQQIVEWTRDDLGEFPMFTPMMVTQEIIEHTVDSEADGLSQMWDGKKLVLPKGARVAVGATFKFQSGINGLLDFSKDENLGAGKFKVQDSSEDGFKFKVHLAPNLYEHLRYRRTDLAGANIMVHVVSAALGILQRDYKVAEGEDEEGWKSLKNLVGLAELLQENNLGHWSDDDFNPEMAATGLYPHQLPAEGAQL